MKSPLTFSKGNKDKIMSKKKYYIVLEEKPRMYLAESGTFIAVKELALGINNPDVAEIALDRINNLRKIEKQKVLCTIVYE